MISIKKFLIFFNFLSFYLLFTNYSLAQSNNKMNIGLSYPISSNGANAGDYTNSFSFNAIVGLSKAEVGVSIAGIANVIKRDAKGMQLSGCLNKIGGDANGMQLSGLANLISHRSNGWTIAGLLNKSSGSSNIQISGVANISDGDSSRVQVAGLINKSKVVSAIQVGVINIATDKSKFQLGLINISKLADYQIGIINLSKNGDESIGASMDETQTSLITFRSGGKRIYGLIGIGINTKAPKSLYALETGLGSHFPISEDFRFNLELANIVLADFKKGSYTRFSIKALPSYNISPRVEFFAGPSFNYVYLENRKGEDLTHSFLWKKSSNNNLKGLYFGGTFGVNIHLFKNNQL